MESILHQNHKSMSSIPGYQIIETLKEDPNFIIWRGLDSENRPVICKVLKWESISLKEKAALRSEYDILKMLEAKPFVIRAYELIDREDIHAIILEDFGGKSIRSLLQERQFTLSEILKIGISCASALAEIHSSGIIHKDINPANLVLNPQTGDLKVIDFGISETVSLKSLGLHNPDKLEGTITYISPEQTGRMNRNIDHRSDLYSLGITLYELCCGKVPFAYEDPLEIIHAHIATYPPDPILVNPNLPKPLSDIIIKLTEKIGESRYQSAQGLKYDLEKCLDLLTSHGSIEEFEIAEKDFSSSFQIPQKLYGRQEDIIRLFDAYTNAFEGNRNTVLIDGLSGTGKSALVHELFKILKNFQGVKTFYISGKFDQFQKTIPYNAFMQAFNSYVSFVLSENREFIHSKRRDILDALDGKGSVLLEIIPSLELITGKLEIVEELDPSQSQNRLFYIFKKFILSICNQANPIVLFLDDLQWADSGSLGLIKILMSEPEIRHLLFIGAYRTNEISSTHPFSIMIQDCIEEGLAIDQINVGNLNISDIKSLISETLFKNEDEIFNLAELVYSKTSGNAFFVNQFLRSLYEKNLIYFDDKNSNGNPEWKWDIERIILEKITDNVVSLMTEKILELSENTSNSMKIASCIGNRFNLKMLSLILGKNLQETFLLLWEAVQKNLLIPIGEYKIFLISEEVSISDGIDLEINFIHDRVQQSAYGLIGEEEKKNIHHKIGNIYFNQLSVEERSERIFEIIHHLNFGSDLIDDKIEIYELVKLNYSTGLRAKKSGAYEASLSYFEMGLKLIEKLDLNNDLYQLKLDFLSEAAETSWLLSRIEAMTSYADSVLKMSKSPFDKIKIYKVLITYNVSMGNGVTALERASEILEEFGVSINIFPSQISIVKELLILKSALLGKKINSLLDSKPLKDKKVLAIINLLSIASSPAYTASPNLLPILIFKQVYISVKHGIAEASAFAYMSMGLISCGALNDIENGYKFGQVSLKLLEKYPSPEFTPKTNIVFNSFVRFWKEPLRNTLTPLLDSYKKSLEVGDLEFAGIGCYIYALHSLHTGKELGSLIREMKIYSEVLENLNQSDRLPYHRMFYQLAAIYNGTSQEPDIFKGEIYDPEKNIPIHLERKDRTAIFTINFCKGLLSFNFGKMELAVQFLAESLKDQDAVVASPNLPILFLYLSLAYIGYAKENGIKKQYIRKIKSYQKKLKFWSKHSPENYLHKYYITEAELSGLLGKEKDAKEFYDLAILNARKNEYINEEALAWELGGRFYIGKNEILAEVYLQKAYTCYMKWGAFAKTKSLELAFPNYIRGLKNSHLYRDTSVTKTNTFHKSTILATSSNRMDVLDLSSILKASQAISSEIELSILISNLMRLMAENAGAEKGFLIMEEEGEYWIDAKYGEDKNFSRIRLFEFEDIASSIVNYVINSKSSVVLDNAIEQSTHTDEYIKRMKPKSILCMPLLNRGQMSGILYLENNLLSGAFTEQSLNILTLLSSQAAISIQNARFYKHLKKVNQAYERFVPREFLQLLEKKSILDVELGQFIERQMTVMFCDIRDFTHLSEEMSPEENFKFINSFLRRMEPAISKNKGFIDKYIGDAIMALFIERADDALLAAIEMRSILQAYNLHREKSNYQHIRVGIGINTGELMLGTIGGKARMDGTVISDAVNLASRIESLTKTFHVPILVSEHLVNKLENKNQFYLREIDRLRVKGKQKLVTIYECFNCDKQSVIDRKLETIDLYNKGLASFRDENYYEAIDYFNECQVSCPEDPIPVIYLNRCNQFIREKSSKDKKEKYTLDDIGSKKVLLVDDNAAFLEITSHIFLKKGYEVLTAESENIALFKYENFLPDIVITDVNLEDGPSYSLIQGIRRIATNYNKHLIIVVTSADDSPNAIEVALKVGGDFFFRKPIAFDDLFQRLRNAIIETEKL